MREKIQAGRELLEASQEPTAMFGAHFKAGIPRRCRPCPQPPAAPGTHCGSHKPHHSHSLEGSSCCWRAMAAGQHVCGHLLKEGTREGPSEAGEAPLLRSELLGLGSHHVAYCVGMCCANSFLLLIRSLID